jgi:hypothetical protein
MNGLLPKKLTTGFAIAIVAVLGNAWILSRHLSQFAETEPLGAPTIITSTLPFPHPHCPISSLPPKTRDTAFQRINSTTSLNGFNPWIPPMLAIMKQLD